MSWIVDWHTVAGPIGEHANDGSNRVWLNETVRFSLTLDPRVQDSHLMLSLAQRAANWEGLPQLTITDSRSVMVRPNRASPLEVDYCFSSLGSGRKQLHFNGIPRAIAARTPTMRRPAPALLFPPIENLELEVMVTALTMENIEAASSRIERAEEHIAEDLVSDRRERRSRAREQRRELSGGVDRVGLFTFRLKTDTEILGMRNLAEVEEYVANLEAAIQETPALNLNRTQHTHWTVRRTRQGIEFYQIPNRPTTEEAERRLRIHSTVLFERDDWVVAIFPGERVKALFPARALAGDLQITELAARFAAIITVLDLPGTILYTLAERLLETLIPPRMLVPVGITLALWLGIFSALRLVAGAGARRAGSRMAGEGAAVEGTRATETAASRIGDRTSRGTTRGGSGGGSSPPVIGDEGGEDSPLRLGIVPLSE